MLVEGIFIGRGVRALAGKRLPGESTQGVRLYAAMRVADPAAADAQAPDQAR